MWVKELDTRVLNFIELLDSTGEEISIRRIARWLWKEKSLRSIQLSLERLRKSWNIYKTPEWRVELIEKDFIKKIETKTKLIPLIWNIACWWPVLAEEYIEDYVKVSEDLLKSRNNYFLLRTSWDSMDKKWINLWDVILVKQQNTANNWDIVVALLWDSATLKEFRMENGIVKLIPHSTNPDNKIIIVTDDLIIQWVYERNLGQF